MIEYNQIYNENIFDFIEKIPDKSIQLIITSPPYWGLRNYSNNANITYNDWSGQLGLEEDFNLYIKHMVEIFNQCYNKLKLDGSLYVNLGDTYRNKSLCGIPDRFKIAMIDAGWICRNDIIWKKPNCMPQSVKNRFSNDYERLFFFTINKEYKFNTQYEPFKNGKTEIVYRKMLRKNKQYNVKEYYQKNMPYYKQNKNRITSQESAHRMWGDVKSLETQLKNGRLKRTVWEINTTPSKHNHVAPYPKKLIEIPIKASTNKKDLVFDPFMGSGTTAMVAKELGRNYLGCEINKEYIEIAEKQLNNVYDNTLL